MHLDEHNDAKEQIKYLIQRRDALTDKIRFGLVVINGASLLALFGILENLHRKNDFLGITYSNAFIVSVAFILGLILSLYALAAQQNMYGSEAGDAAARAITIRRVIAAYELDATPENHERLRKMSLELQQLKLTGFQFSWRVIAAQNFAAGAWVFGILWPVIHVLSTSNLKWPSFT